jgi:hypothetical protein
METENMTAEQEKDSKREAKKAQQRAAWLKFKLLHAADPEKGREAARLWFEQHAERTETSVGEKSAFHRRILSEADPERERKVAEAAKKREADAGRAQHNSRETVKQWRKRNPNKVKKLSKLYQERQQPK